ncbi:MAG: mitofilin family membrane protein [Pseudomonadota bacterium]
MARKKSDSTDEAEKITEEEQVTEDNVETPGSEAGAAENETGESPDGEEGLKPDDEPEEAQAEDAAADATDTAETEPAGIEDAEFVDIGSDTDTPAEIAETSVEETTEAWGGTAANDDSPAEPDPLEGPFETSAEPEPQPEPTPEPEREAPDTVTAASQAPAPAPEKRSGGGMGLFGYLIGGAVAGLIGFGAATYVMQQQEPPAAPPAPPPPDLSQLETAIAAIEAKIDALETAGTPAEPPDLSGAVGQIEDTISGSLAGLNDRLSALDARLADIEQAPAAAPAPEVVVDETALNALRDQLADEVARTADLTSTNAQLNQEIQNLRNADRDTSGERAAAATAQIAAAVSTGAPFEDALTAYANATGNPAPDGLSAAASGVPSLSSLQSAFPDAARAALEASLVASPGGTATDRASNFLRSALGARSVTPREGDSPDAVLSRAGAAVSDGNIADALTELQALPDAGREAMSGWMSDAQTREAALAALTQLSTN